LAAVALAALAVGAVGAVTGLAAVALVMAVRLRTAPVDSSSRRIISPASARYASAPRDSLS